MAKKYEFCTTSILIFLEHVTQLFDISDPVDVIYLDFWTAYNKVPHQRLIAKRKATGISGDMKVD